MPIDMLIDTVWCWLMLTDTDWCWLVHIDADWNWLMLIDPDWSWLVLIDADRCWLMLINADWCSNKVQPGFLLSERTSGASPVIFLLCILTLSFLLTGALLFQPKVPRSFLVNWMRANWRPWLKSTKKTLTFMLTTHTVFSIEFVSSIVWQMSGAFALDLVIAWIVKKPFHICYYVFVYLRKIYSTWSLIGCIFCQQLSYFKILVFSFWWGL